MHMNVHVHELFVCNDQNKAQRQGIRDWGLTWKLYWPTWLYFCLLEEA